LAFDWRIVSTFHLDAPVYLTAVDMEQSLSINIGKDPGVELWRQLYFEIRRLIRAGELAAGDKVPPSRELAELLQVSRKTVREAYQQLTTEGYLETKPGSGTFVHTDIKKDDLKAAQAVPKSAGARGSRVAPVVLSDYARDVLRIEPLKQAAPAPNISFFSWQPAFGNLPQTRWTQILNREYLRAQKTRLQPERDPRGHEPLRQSLARVLTKLRGVKCTPEQIIVLTGLQQAVDLVARMHVEAGTAVAFENPGDPVTRAAFAAYGAKLYPLPVDEQGMQVEWLLRWKASRKIALTYCTPSHQFPTGALMPLSRKLKLLSWAKERGALIFEDDYDSQFGCVGYPTPSLQGLDGGHSVIYFGTFTKVLFPPFSIGYLILPEHLAELYSRALSLATDELPVQLQSALSNFIDRRYLERHINRIEQIYEERRAALIGALKENLGDRMEMVGENSGLYVMVRFDTKLSDEQIVRKGQELGIGLVSTKPFYLTAPRRGEFIFAWADLTEDLIFQGVQKLRTILKK
jgi:GntR family transcriptional regulator/MocR family aminotransferase